MMRRKSGLSAVRNANELLALAQPVLGHSSPSLCPRECPPPTKANVLGTPLSIREAAALIGCSVWTLRQTLLPMGLPHFRTSPNSKLHFYENQIITWLLRQQEKGGRTH